jgi:NAD(P)-dependent dehydrogenase (short-subunit alcohol dehydrogenase family)
VRRLLAGAADCLLEATVVGSFSRAGFELRSRLEAWSTPPRLDGKVVVVTGASSGIGRAVALGLANLGAGLVLVARDERRLARTRVSAMTIPDAGPVVTVALDLVDPHAVRSFAARLTASEDRLDGLVHCAGALFREYRAASDGTELTLATHVVAPFRLTGLLCPLLRRAPAPVIVTVSSGGMYTQRFELDRLELTAHDYRGATAYARAKRAQVVLAHEWAHRWGPDGIASYAMHPGWVDTPGLATGLPSFGRLGPLLRTPPQGADTVVWLAAGGPHQRASLPSRPGGIWLDRHRRPAFYLPTTYRGPAERRRDGEALWEWCTHRVRHENHSRLP